MSPRSAAIVVTTIFPPKFLAGYLENLRRFGSVERTQVIVIPDRKTPASVGEACDRASREGFRVSCPSLEEQAEFLRRFNVPTDWIPFDSDNRRNVGFLMALDGGTDVLISIDDDNFCRDDEDFCGLHSLAGTRTKLPVRRSSDGWVNLCDELEFALPGMSYPRGFPYKNRHSRRELLEELDDVEVAMNVGLWLDDPDVDAVGRLGERPHVTAYSGEPFILGHDAWTPINTQNTALTRSAAAAYYYVRMGYAIEGLKIDRYGDILSGYFVQKCIRHLRESIRVGDPICHHHRTPHNLFKDLYHELAGMVVVEELLPWLRELKLSGDSYVEAYACLADELAAASEHFRGFVFDQGGRDFLRFTSENMKTWLTALSRMGM